MANCSGEFKLPRRAHQIFKERATFGRPLGGYSPDPHNFHKKGETPIVYPPPEKLHTLPLKLLYHLRNWAQSN